ncbi:MAG: EFR1 family ferrodoxin [Deltaproteobacteria bacterium]|nr:EFR1 family ferrodoxin [Deltaproteobacteria bacterium]
MEQRPLPHRIVYLSPAGTTRLAAETIADQLKALNQTVELFDLSSLIQAGSRAAVYAAWPATCCLWIGSPVYCDHALPIVEDFIRNLPDGCHGFSIPFATYGGVTSGLTLPEMAELLGQRNFTPLAAAKILALHSSTWCAPKPLAAGHPSADELQQLRSLVVAVEKKLMDQPPAALERSLLNYLPEEMQQSSAAKSLALVKRALPPLKIDQTLCTQCGTCAQGCPMGCIDLRPYPEIRSECIRCLQCVRNCPEGAFNFDPEPLQSRILELSVLSEEEQISQFFT